MAQGLDGPQMTSQASYGPQVGRPPNEITGLIWPTGWMAPTPDSHCHWVTSHHMAHGLDGPHS